MPFAIESTDRGSTREAKPFAASSQAVPLLVKTGVPTDIASNTGKPNPSNVDGKQNADAAAINPGKFPSAM